MIFCKMNKYPAIILTASIILGSLYLMFAYCCIYNKFWDVLTTFISIILSVIGGAALSMLIYNHQKNQTDNALQKRLAVSLLSEISGLKNTLNSDGAIEVKHDSLPETLKFCVFFPHSTVVDECIKSGLFCDNIDEFLRISCYTKYYKTQSILLMNILHNNLENRYFAMQVTICHENMEKFRSLLLEHLDDMLRRYKL